MFPFIMIGNCLYYFKKSHYFVVFSVISVGLEGLHDTFTFGQSMLIGITGQGSFIL